MSSNERRRFAIAALAAVWAASCARPKAAVAPAECPNPFSLAPEHVALRIPNTSYVPEGRATLVGTIVDSASRRPVVLGQVRLTGVDGVTGEFMSAATDSSGGYAIVGVRPGRYRRWVLAVNYTPHRDTVIVPAGVDTMLFVLHHGPAICRVELTRDRE